MKCNSSSLLNVIYGDIDSKTYIRLICMSGFPPNGPCIYICNFAGSRVEVCFRCIHEKRMYITWNLNGFYLFILFVPFVPFFSYGSHAPAQAIILWCRHWDFLIPCVFVSSNTQFSECRPEDLRRPFGQFGRVKDIYLPRDYYTG